MGVIFVLSQADIAANKHKNKYPPTYTVYDNTTQLSSTTKTTFNNETMNKTQTLLKLSAKPLSNQPL